MNLILDSTLKLERIMKRLIFDVNILTPLFMSGHNQNHAEVRAPSVKGLLRWWFRALGGDWNWESWLFGSQEQGSPVIFRIIDKNIFLHRPYTQRFSNRQAYLGYGPIGFDKRDEVFKNSRASLTGSFSLEVVIFSNVDDKDLRALLLSLWSLSVFGGMGSRSRRGWGSVSIKPSDENAKSFAHELGLDWEFHSLENLRKNIHKLEEKRRVIFGELPKNLPEYTRFSHLSRFCIGGEFDLWKDAMDDIGGRFIRFRKRRYYDDVKRFMEDVERGKVRPFYSPASKYNAPYGTAVPKAIFGLPNNYFSRSRKEAKRKPHIVNVMGERQINGREEIISRRASPLLISINKIGDKYTWLLTYLPAQFLPPDSQLLLTVPGKQIPESWTSNRPPRANTGVPNYNLIDKFLSFNCRNPISLNREMNHE